MSNKKLLFFFLALSFSLSAVFSPAFAGPKVDALLNVISGRANLNTMKAFGVKAVEGVATTDVLIKTASLAVLQGVIESVGGKIRTTAGDIVTATIPVDAISVLENLNEVVYIEAAKPMIAKMDYARSVTNVDDVQNGEGTTSAYSGRGVIVGVADSGIDCEHADFKDGSGNTRIVAYWDQTVSGSGVTEISGSSGTEYTGSTLADGGTCTNSPDSDTAEEGHGTHVAGIAAGSDSTYKGVAPDANIIAVILESPNIATGGYSGYGTTLSTSVVDGVNYIFKKAQALGKPAVANLSIGTSLGAHDGTSLFEAALDALLIESGSTEKEGRAIVNAAGNENAEFLNDSTAGGIHATVSVSSGDPKAFEFLATSASSQTYISSVGGIYADIWFSGDCTVAINSFNRTKTQTKSAVGPVSSGSEDGDTIGTVTMSVDFTEGTSSLNNKKHAIAQVNTTDNIYNYSFDLVFNGTCTGDAWLYYDYTPANIFTKGRASSTTLGAAAAYDYVDGDSNKTMTIPATANKVIAVGSFMARDTFTNINGNTVSQASQTNGTAGDISTFSSLGNSADNRTKPDLVAPGEPIISTLASTVTSVVTKGDDTHHKLQGTSMAAPHVTGVVALMLEKNGCLNAATIKSYLTEQADTDSFTGSTIPNATWGYGKVDALSAVNRVTASSCAPSNPSETVECNSDSDCASGQTCENNSCMSGSDGGSSSGVTASAGCGNNISAGKDRTAVSILLFVLFLISWRFLWSVKGQRR